MESVAKQDGEFNLFLKHTVLKNKYNFVSFFKNKSSRTGNFHTGMQILLQHCWYIHHGSRRNVPDGSAIFACLPACRPIYVHECDNPKISHRVKTR